MFQIKFYFCVKIANLYNSDGKLIRVNIVSGHKWHTAKMTMARLQISDSLESNGKAIDLKQ